MITLSVIKNIGRDILAAVASVLLLASTGAAHEIPADVRVQAFVKPEGRTLQLLLRVPLTAMREVDVPRRGPGYLDLARADAALRTAANLWLADNIDLYEGETRLAYPRLIDARVSLPSDKSFASFAEARAHLAGPRLPEKMELFWNQGLMDVLFEYRIESATNPISINPRLERLGLRVAIALRFLPPNGAERAFEFHGDPGIVALDPRWHQAALRFVESGFVHILEGADHLLFLLCLVIPFRRFGALVMIVTSFTVAHSITLIASAYDLGPTALWFPPLIEMLIAISIVYMAIENVIGTNVQRRWMITFAFGLVHGFAFSFALREQLQFAGDHLLTSLLSFNLGVELGQLLVLAALVPLLGLLFRHVVPERIGIIILSVLIGHTGWHWMTERAELLSKFPWPAIDAPMMAAAMRWAMVLL
ncbi:MAG TPA: HupE/UreJ family protein, partial [Burkholderiales bacterium]|nr:HupE/UreJ family protein [Burkholderiales bacterium]